MSNNDITIPKKVMLRFSFLKIMLRVFNKYKEVMIRLQMEIGGLKTNMASK